MSHALRVGIADQIAYFRAYNTDGSAKTDLTSSTTGLTLSVFRVGAAAVSISSLSAKAADNTAHADGAIRAVSGNLYTVDLPDAACADQVPSISVKGSYTGGVIEGPEHPLVGYNPATVAVGALQPTTAGRTIAVSSAGAVELDSAVGTQITNIETFATRVTTGLVQDGAVYQFTANMLELGPSGGGGSSVNVLPATGIVADRSAGTTLLPVVGETISQSITVYQSDGTTAVSLSGKTLKVIFETMSGVDVAVVAAADITISGTSSNIVTFAYPSAVTASERTLRFAIRDAAAPLTMYLQGVCSVVAAPKVDA